MLWRVLDAAGLFRWAALHALRAARGDGRRAFLFIIGLSAATATLFTNDGTVLILTPITAEMLAAAGLTPAAMMPYLIANAFIADAFSTPLPSSNLVDILAADFYHVPATQYAAAMVPTSLAAAGAASAALYLLYGQALPRTARRWPPHGVSICAPDRACNALRHARGQFWQCRPGHRKAPYAPPPVSEILRAMHVAGAGRIRTASQVRIDLGRVVVEAEHALGLCEELLRSLPQSGEPQILWEIRRELGGNDDLRVDDASQQGTGPWLVYLHTMQDDQRFWEEIAKPVESALRRADGSVGRLWPTAKRAGSAAEAVAAVLQGSAAIVLGGKAEGTLLYSVARHPHRAIEMPTSEPVIVGPKEAFVEDLDTNLALMRGWLPHATLRIQIVHIGRRTKTRIAVLYLEDVVRPGLVEALLDGLYRIRTDAIRTDRQVAEYLTSGSLTPFPLSESSERVDSVATAVAGGRAAVFVEHSPFPFLVPTTFFEFQKDSESALGGPLVAGFVRTMRHLGQVLALTAPGLIVALLSANPGPLRPELAATLLVTRVGLPYPVFPEMFVMMLVIDIFNEATAQAPGGIGTALSIVGTLIIGQISVQARLVSELVMIVAAATSMGSFLALRYQFSYAIRIWKYVILGLSGVLGLFGWIAGIMFLVGHLASLKSSGVPYLAPLAPLNARSLLWGAITRPNHPQDTRRSPVWAPVDSARAQAVPPEPSGNEKPGGPAS